MVVLQDSRSLYAHLACTRGSARAVVVRVDVYQFFRLGPAEVVRAPLPSLCKSHGSFGAAATAVHLALYKRRPVYWDEYEVYVRGLGPTCRARLGNLSCRFYVGDRTIYTGASPSLAARVVEPLRDEDGTGEWVRLGHLRPFVPPGLTSPVDIASQVNELIDQEQHHMCRGGSRQRARRREEPEPTPKPRAEVATNGLNGRTPPVLPHGGSGSAPASREGAAASSKPMPEPGEGGGRLCGEAAGPTIFRLPGPHSSVQTRPNELLGGGAGPHPVERRRRRDEEEGGHGERRPTGDASAGPRAPAPATAAGSSRADGRAKRRKVKLVPGELVFVACDALDAERRHAPVMIVGHSFVRMQGAAGGAPSPVDVRLAPWTAAGSDSDPTAHFTLPRSSLLGFIPGFRAAWDMSSEGRERDGLVDAFVHQLSFRAREGREGPTTEELWKRAMGEGVPLPPRLAAHANQS